MTRADLQALARRVEAAQGANRELDAEIYCTLNPEWQPSRTCPDVLWRGDPTKPESIGAPAFSASLDAAVSLVPAGWRVNTADWSVLGRFTWMLKGPCLKRVPNDDSGWDAGSDWYVSGVSEATPALALTAAALRALAEEAGE
jgi:hypothetical protein